MYVFPSKDPDETQSNLPQMTHDAISAQSLTLERTDSTEQLPSTMEKSVCFHLDQATNLEPLDDAEENIEQKQVHKPKIESMMAMITEDAFVSHDPIKRSSKIILPAEGSPNVSPNASPATSPAPKLTTNRSTVIKLQTCNPQITTSYSKTTHSRSHTREKNNNNGAIEIIGVMSKMSLLVLIASITSILGNIGNVFIEIHLLQTVSCVCFISFHLQQLY